MKKKTVKKLGVLALVSLMVLSGSAWLTSRQTANGENNIKTGRFNIDFENQKPGTVITLDNNNSIPMTREYAVANLTPYEFDIKNSGTVTLNYKISISNDGYVSTFPNGKINVLIAKVDDGASDVEKKAALLSADIQNVIVDEVIDSNTNFGAAASQHYVMLAYVDQYTVNDEYQGNSISFKLEVNASQPVNKMGIYIQVLRSAGLTPTDYYGRLRFNDYGSESFNSDDLTSFIVNGTEIVGSGYPEGTLMNRVKTDDTGNKYVQFGVDIVTGKPEDYPYEILLDKGDNTYSITYKGQTYSGNVSFNDEGFTSDTPIVAD